MTDKQKQEKKPIRILFMNMKCGTPKRKKEMVEKEKEEAEQAEKRIIASETVPVSSEEEHQPTVVSNADGEKILNK